MKPQVLIVGAGPTGLVLALALEKQNIPFRIIDKSKGPGEASRAMVVHARTLELYRQLGLAEELVDRGIQIRNIHLYKEGKKKTTANLGDIGEGLSPYPYILSMPQDEHEQVLVNKLKDKGIEVEWNTELLSFQDKGDFVQAVTRTEDAEEEVVYAYLCGCDGAHSAVRKGAGFSFAGGTYERQFFVADVEAPVANEDLHIHLFEQDLCLVMPIRTTGHTRLTGLVPKEVTKEPAALQFTDIAPFIEPYLHLTVEKVHWFSIYHVHHRVSGSFRQGRVFIAGDAAHIHSPAGGQGMNTGIGDAVNLAWKLADVLYGKADKAILDSYDHERRAFAETLVKTTDRLFNRIVGRGPSTSFVREVAFPYMLPSMLQQTALRKNLFKAASQIRIRYRHSILSTGKAGKVRGGDRLPYVVTNEGDNFLPLQSCSWQFHVYGGVKPSLQQLSEDAGIPLYRFPWTDSMKTAGVSQDAVYLIRPDGYVAVADAEQNDQLLRSSLVIIKTSQ